MLQTIDATASLLELYPSFCLTCYNKGEHFCVLRIAKKSPMTHCEEALFCDIIPRGNVHYEGGGLMKRIICTATILKEETLKEVINHLEKAGVNYVMLTKFKIKVDYNGYDPGTMTMISDLFESLDAHAIHYFY